MIAIAALRHFFAIILSPSILPASPVLCKPTTIIRFKQDLELLEKEDSENNVEETISEDEQDSEDETSPNPSAIFSVEDDESDTSSISENSICDKAPYSTFHANAHISIDNLYLDPSSDLEVKRIEVKSAVPQYIFEEWNGPEQEHSPVGCERVYDVDEDTNYDARFLTYWARQKAEGLSMKVREQAQRKARKWAAETPRKASEHPAPRSRVRPSELKGHGRSSQLRSSWTIEDLEEDVMLEATLEELWADEEYDVLGDLEDLQSFFSKRK